MHDYRGQCRELAPLAAASCCARCARVKGCQPVVLAFGELSGSADDELLACFNSKSQEPRASCCSQPVLGWGADGVEPAVCACQRSDC